MNEQRPENTRPSGSNGAPKRRKPVQKKSTFAFSKKKSAPRTPRPRSAVPAGSARRPSENTDPRSVDRTPVRHHKPVSRARAVWSKIGRVCLSIFLIGTITGSLVVGAFAVYVFGFVDSKMDFDLNHLSLKYTTIIYATNEKGEQEEIKRLHDGTNRIWVDEDKISQNVFDAFVSSEDKRFMDHDGVDWRRTLYAFVNMFTGADVGGGSTITQQLVKNLTGDNQNSPMRKIQEIMRARDLESNYAKEAILTAYVNRVYYGNNCYGIQIASNYYFDKEPADLTIAQAATLTSIVKSPDGFDPYKKAESNTNRRQWTIKEMAKNGYITEAERDAALKEDVKLVDRQAKAAENAQGVNSYFIDALIDDVVANLMSEKGYSKTHAETVLYTGGLQIYSTLNSKIQTTLETFYKNDKNFQKQKAVNGKQPESSMVIMDYQGHIVAVVGGRGEKTVNRGLNRATQSKRQPGSTMKPIGVYAPAIENNLITWGTKTKDLSMTMNINGKNQPYPYNYGKSKGSGGMVTTQYALMRSLNTVPARILEQLGYQKSFDFLTQNLGITTLVDSVKIKGKTYTDLSISALALGGPTYGLTMKEITAAYSTFGNLGQYYKPLTYTVIKDFSNEEIILQQSEEPKKAMGEDTANIMNEMLQTVVRGSNGTGGSAAFGDWPIYAKTGTTSDNKDFTFVGGTPYYVAGVWYGFDQPSAMSGGSTIAAVIWKNVMSQIHKDLELKDFPESSLASYRRYCTSSGLLATNSCPSTNLGWFKNSYLPVCTMHGGSLRDAVNKPAAVTSKAPVSSKSETSSKAASQTSSKAASSAVSSAPPASSKPASSKAPAQSSSSTPAAASSKPPSNSSTSAEE